MKSVFTGDKGKGKDSVRRTPPEFRQMARKLVRVVREQLAEMKRAQWRPTKLPVQVFW